MRDDAARILDMYLACIEAQEVVADADRQAFDADRVLQLALSRLLEVIGEAARYVSDEYRSSHSEVPWTSIVGLRHRIVHEYFRLDLDIIWRIVTEDVPALSRVLAALVPSENAE
jgi:uncharacterized protein with HEPN domain